MGVGDGMLALHREKGDMDSEDYVYEMSGPRTQPCVASWSSAPPGVEAGRKPTLRLQRRGF